MLNAKIAPIKSNNCLADTYAEKKFTVVSPAHIKSVK